MREQQLPMLYDLDGKPVLSTFCVQVFHSAPPHPAGRVLPYGVERVPSVPPRYRACPVSKLRRHSSQIYDTLITVNCF
uniref:Velvet domain-containing protein n=1 Tax=Angiostrongylus cantonensis TaxID=6313 RepID=A0A0K0CUH5_ANGCA